MYFFIFILLMGIICSKIMGMLQKYSGISILHWAPSFLNCAEYTRNVSYKEKELAKMR